MMEEEIINWFKITAIAYILVIIVSFFSALLGSIYPDSFQGSFQMGIFGLVSSLVASPFMKAWGDIEWEKHNKKVSE